MRCPWVATWVTERECFNWPGECKIVYRSGFANVNIVFLICPMFIIKRPIQIKLFRIHLVSIIKCVTCQARFWINYWHSWMDKQRQHSLRYLPDLTQQYFSSTSAVFLSRNVTYANYSGRKAPSHKMDSVCFLWFFWFANFALWTLSSRHFAVCSSHVIPVNWNKCLRATASATAELLSILLFASCGHVEHQPCLPISAQKAESGQPWELNCIPEIIAR